ncbi:radical SAM protein [Candidatus Bathyarchaeota archaeon]|nr:radical SAM protein [Candidatus Bathyarchaeota archaeon]
MNEDYPKALQVEVTNRCNFSCRMCVRRVWNIKPSDLNLDLYEKIAESSFPHLERVILYGFGEPLVHPNFLEMLRVARKYLPRDGEILVSTNGSLFNRQLAEKILRNGVNNVSFSIDTTDIVKLEQIREGSKPEDLLRNFHYVAEMKKRYSFKLGVEVVVMRSNFEDLPTLVKRIAQEEADYILVSHVVPYTEEIFQDSVYVTLSRKPLEIMESFLSRDQKFVLEAIYEALGSIYGFSNKSRASNIIRELWRKAEENGYWINPPLFFKSKDKIAIMKDVERVFDLSRKIAHDYHIEISLPNLYPDAKERKCPYIEKETVFVRSDGTIAPCSEFAYHHPVYINMHIKSIHPISFGDLKRESLREIWNKKDYVKFREIRKRIAENIPWCGDCLYSSSKCFFTETNALDCYANEPGCNECLYSVNLAQCNI